jgi:hypothetical protein
MTLEANMCNNSQQQTNMELYTYILPTVTLV